MKYTRDQALCMAFYVDYTEANVKECKEKLGHLETFDICYNVLENEPVLVSIYRIRSNPLGYIRYTDTIPPSEESDGKKRKKLELVTKGQIKQFLDEAFCSRKRDNSVLYSQQQLTTNEVYTIIKQHTSVFGTNTAQSFAAWCRSTKVEFLNAREKKGSRNVRELSVLDDSYHDELVASIVTYLSKYQDSLKALIRGGMELVGYARKSPTDSDSNNNARLLQSMINNLQERSLATRIYVSPSTWASTPFEQRDLKPNSRVMKNLKNVCGSTQDLLEYINSCDHDVCLVSIGFAGLTTRSIDLIELIENNPAIKKIAIETFAINNEVFIFDAQNLQNDRKVLNRFDHRTEFYSRSK